MMENDKVYMPYFDPDFETLIERIHPPSICIDNDTCHDCTLVKVDSANKIGVLLEMVQVLTDLDLVISKSYISSDGRWFMDVFHVTDHLGNKLIDHTLILYIQQVLCAATPRGGIAKLYRGREVNPPHVSTDHTALEMTCTDRPGLLSEISAVLATLNCLVTAAVAWTHNSRAASIIYLEDELKGGPIDDQARLALIEDQLDNVVDAHHCYGGEKRSVRLTRPNAGHTHTERRLHQLMAADRDYERSSSCSCSGGGGWKECAHRHDCYKTYVSIEKCKEKDYSVVTIKTIDRPKLLFDTVCTLTDMQYVVFHAAVSSKDGIAAQEYYIRHKDGCTLNLESEKQKVTQCLVAAVERRVSHGLKLDVSTRNRVGLLSDVTRIFRENGLSIVRAEIGARGDRATGSFYVTDVSGHDVSLNTIELIKKEIGGTVAVVDQSSGWSSPGYTSSSISRTSSGGGYEEKPKTSLGSLFWSHLERHFGSIRS